MTTDEPNYEVEDFDKTVTFESGQFAIVDAEVVKGLKDKVPLADKAIFVATKQSRDNVAPFKVEARYDDAVLRELVITPAAANEADDSEPMGESFEGRNLETRQGSGVQKQGKGGNAAERKIKQKNRIAVGSRPKSGERSERNKRYSAKGDQKTKLTKGKSSVEQRIDQKLSHNGAELDNFGQPRVASECLELLSHIKNDTLTEGFLNSLGDIKLLRGLLADVRDNGRVKGKSFDLVYEAVEVLDKHWREDAQSWVKNIEELIEKGMLDV